VLCVQAVWGSLFDVVPFLLADVIGG